MPLPTRISGITERRSHWAVVLLILGCASDPTVHYADFEAARTSGELARFLGGYPNACVSVGTDHELCRWTLRGNNRVWETLAQSVRTGRQINVLCVLPGDGAARAEGSCRVHPRASRPFEAGEDDEASRRRAAQRQLETARGLIALSHLVGDIPDDCRDLLGSRVCSWRVSNRRAGHSLLAAAAGTRGQVRLECQLSADAESDTGASCIAVPIR